MNEKYLPTTPEGRLWRFVEECAEVAEQCMKATHAACKVGRFGLGGDDLVTVLGSNPRDRLLAEIADLEHAILQLKGDLEP